MTTEKCLQKVNKKTISAKVADLTIIEALDRILAGINKTGFNEKLTKEYKVEFDFLCKKLDFTTGQVILLCIMAEVGEPMSWRMIAGNLSVSRLRAMAFTPDIEDLIKRGWVLPYRIYNNSGNIDGFRLEYGVIAACRKNDCFMPESIAGLTDSELIMRAGRIINKDDNIPVYETNRRILDLISANPDLNISKKLNCLTSDNSKLYIVYLLYDYVMCSQNQDEAYLPIKQLLSINYSYEEAEAEKRLFLHDCHELQKKKLIEFKCNDGLADKETFVLTNNACQEFLADCDLPKRLKNPKNQKLRSYTTIKTRQLFYNEAEMSQINRLNSVLLETEFNKICARLDEKGLRKGIACLFYGEPGTGKTETVLQLAKQTGRNVLEVNIASIRDKYVGESEKNIKELFDNYRTLCRSSAICPILFFNEADSLINSRFEKTRSSVEKMDNSIQNIILQELESLEGILIATTNLTGTLDRAFDRRFLFKIEFKKPDSVSRSKIWHSMMPDLSLDVCNALAMEFDFTGGQIENIVRKCNIDYILNGAVITSDIIKQHCLEENIIRNRLRHVGFR